MLLRKHYWENYWDFLSYLQGVSTNRPANRGPSVLCFRLLGQEEKNDMRGQKTVKNEKKSRQITVRASSGAQGLPHGNDTELILLVDPGEEGLGGVVEDTPALWPVTLHAGSDQVFVSGDEEEVVINQLEPVSFVHAQERVILSSELSSQLAKCALHQGLHTQPLLLGDSRGKAEAVNAAANTDPGGVDRGLGVNVALDLGHVHVGGVAEALR